MLNLQINDRRARAGAAVAVQPRAASCECWRRGWMPPVVLKTDDLNRWTNELTHTYTRTRVRRECCCTYHTHIGKYIARRSVKWKKINNHEAAGADAWPVPTQWEDGPTTNEVKKKKTDKMPPPVAALRVANPKPKSFQVLGHTN